MRPVVKKILESRVGRAQLFIFSTAFYFEVIAAICIIIGLIVTFLGVPGQILVLVNGGSFITFLTFMFNIIIGIELLKMFCRHDLDSVVEVLLFAVARQVIIEHTTMVDNLLCMISVALLFCIRKFLFVSELKAIHPSLKASSRPPENPCRPEDGGRQTEAENTDVEETRENILKKFSRNSYFE